MPEITTKEKARRLAKISHTLKAMRIRAYRAGVGPIKPTWYQDAIHQGGMTKSGRGSTALGRVARERWCFMPNQVGKSFGGAADDVMIAYGIHPYIHRPVPNIGVVLTVSHLKSIQVMRKLIYDFIPDADKDILQAHKAGIGFFNQNVEKPSRLVLPNGSEIHFMSADQDAMEFESLTLHWFHSDEEMPEEVYNQIQIRLLRHQGHLLCTMTPWQEEGTSGISWTADRILHNHELPESQRGSEIWIAPYITMNDAPWLDKEAILEWKKKVMSPEEYEARFRGIHMQRSGKIFNTFRDQIFKQGKPADSGHLLPADMPLNPEWTLMMLIDPSSPSGLTGALWVAITTAGRWQGIAWKNNELVFYREYREKDLTVKQHVGNILGQNGSDQLTRKYMDGRFMNQKADANTGASYADLYQTAGLWCEPWGANLIQAEIDSTKNYMQGVLDRSSTQPGIFILQGLTELRAEIGRYIFPIHKSGELKGERKYVQHKKSKGICLIDCMKAGCNLELKGIRKHMEADLDFSQFQNPVTG